jgi:hypothetical protein
MRLDREEVLLALDQSGIAAELAVHKSGSPGIMYKQSSDIVQIATALVKVIGTRRWNELAHVARISDSSSRGHMLYFPGVDLI